MSFFSNFFKSSNITTNWEKSLTLDLTFNFSNNSINNIKIGDDFELLSSLGTCENKVIPKILDYNYYSMGIMIGTKKDNKIDTFLLYFNDVIEKKFSPFTGKFIYQNKKILLSDKTTKKEFIAIFGEPYWENIDISGDKTYDEIILFYEFKNLEWQVEFTSDEKLKLFIAIDNPIMSDLENRKNYGVTKSWPPKF